MKHALKLTAVIVLIFLICTGCLLQEEDSKKKVNLSGQSLSNFIVTVNTDSGWSTGTYSVLLEDGTVYKDLLAFNTSDITAKPYNGSIFILGRFLADWVARIDLSDMGRVVYQIDVKGADSSANPYDLDFAGVHTAYLLRYDTESIWIIDPAPADEAGFKKGEIDISAYSTGANPPNAILAMIIGNMYYVLLERSNDGAYDTTSQLLKYDITDPENPVYADNLVLDSVGAQNLSLAGEHLYICAWGRLANSWTDPAVERNPNGGIEVVDLAGFSSNGIQTDDGTNGDNNTYTYGGFFSDFVIVSATKGYILIANWETWPAYYKIVEFDPSAGTVEDAAIDRILENYVLSDIKLSADRTKVFASVQDGGTPANSGIYTIDISDNSVSGPVNTGLDPMSFEVNN